MHPEIPQDTLHGFRQTHVDWAEEMEMHQAFQDRLSQHDFGSELLSMGYVLIFIDLQFDPCLYLVGQTFQIDSDDQELDHWGSFEPLMLVVDHQAQPSSACFVNQDENTLIPEQLFGQNHEGLLQELIRWRELINTFSAADACSAKLAEFYFKSLSH